MSSRMSAILANALLLELALRELSPSQALQELQALRSGSAPTGAVKPLLERAEQSALQELEAFKAEVKAEVLREVESEAQERVSDAIEEVKDEIKAELRSELRSEMVDLIDLQVNEAMDAQGVFAKERLYPMISENVRSQVDYALEAMDLSARARDEVKGHVCDLLLTMMKHYQ